ncbi:zinc finger BED domain-containing protein RICESLEEPER 2-like [Cynara cardunculus var. scolymus]|uniref:zinc finger BED domain-containing protein RICESLEEPER 2-like n=1 Tax=Cynara cardunculus var. scolymus TaxID=59895 RepID=UPI000D62AACA|nr:zinc finger BED domain-containing protein RICESLEEPER 2-like [Cynara cardunculus var. scolymus]
MANPSNSNELCDADEQMKSKRRRKKSIVWEHFTIETIDAECTRACCKQCKKSFAYISRKKPAGTSHLKRHIDLGICPVSRLNQKSNQDSSCTLVSNDNGAQNVDDLPRKRHRRTSRTPSFSFDQDYCRHKIAKMIIMHEYPLEIGEHPGFVDSVRALQPQFKIVSLDAIQRDCLGLYQKEKQSLLNLISGISGRVSLSLDIWSTDQTILNLLSIMPLFHAFPLGIWTPRYLW